jgi:hypothetical protein
MVLELMEQTKERSLNSSLITESKIGISQQAGVVVVVEILVKGHSTLCDWKWAF